MSRRLHSAPLKAHHGAQTCPSGARDWWVRSNGELCPAANCMAAVIGVALCQNCQMEVYDMRQRAIRRLHEAEGFSDLNAEKAELTKKAFLEQLQMKVIELFNHDEPKLFCDLLYCIGTPSREIKGKSKKMLTLRISPDGLVSVRVTVPARESESLIQFLQENCSFDQVPVDVGEIRDEVVRRDQETHVR